MSIQELHANGTMNYLVQKGLITPSAYRRLEMFVEVKALQHTGIKPTEAARIVSEKFKICEQTVWRAVREFKNH